MPYVPSSEIAARVAVLQTRLAALGLDGALIHGTSNLLYYAGTAQQAHLVVPTTGEPRLLVRRVLERARAESPLAAVEGLASLRALAAAIDGRRLGLELDILPVTLFRRYQEALPGLEASDIGPLTRTLRAVKSAWEVDRVRLAAVAAEATFHAVRDALHAGMSELELAIVAESAERRHGFQGVLRWRATTGFECPWVHVLAGASALDFSFTDTPFGGPGLTPAAPYGPSRRIIRRGEPVCVDIALAVDGYIHDQTRVMAVGSLPDDLLHAHEVCRDVHRAFVAAARPGVTGDALWQHSLGVVEAAGLGDRFMGWGDDRVRFVGHGVGLELDELPVIAPRQTMALAAGNVIALEPKLFFPGRGAVGLENTYLIGDDAVTNLTRSPEDVVIVPG